MVNQKTTKSIDPRERYHDEEEKLRVAFEGMQAGLWTALPVIVTGYSPELQTVTLQPTIQALQRDQFGDLTLVSLPQLLDCPVLFPTGGGFTLTFPIKPGDEGLAVFSSRCPDNWWQVGGVQPPYDLTMHDLSHGFYIPGCRSNPRALAGVSTSTVQLRSDDGSTFVEVAGGQVVSVTAPVAIHLNTPTVFVTGDVIAGAGGGNPISLINHLSTGVTSGSDNSGPPTG